MKQYRVVVRLMETAIPKNGCLELSTRWVGPMDHDSAQSLAREHDGSHICNIGADYRFLHCYVEECTAFSVKEFLAWKEQIRGS